MFPSLPDKLNAFGGSSSNNYIVREKCFPNKTLCNGIAECEKGGDEAGCGKMPIFIFVRGDNK